MKKISKLLLVVPISMLLFACSKKTKTSATTTKKVTTDTKVTTKATTTKTKDLRTVTFDLNKGTGIFPSISVEKGSKLSKPDADPTREGYEFNGWYYGEDEWAFIGYVVTEDMTLVAHWLPVDNTLTLTKNIELAGTVSGIGLYKSDSEVTISATTNTGYTFDGWYESGNKVSDLANYTFTMPTKDTIYQAKWTVNNYNITLTSDEEKGTVSGSGLYAYNSSVTITATPEDGYDFDGWYDGDDFVSSDSTYTFTMPYNELEYEAKFKLANYKLKLDKSDKHAGTVSGAGFKEYSSSVTISATTNSGFAFLGWYSGNTRLTTNEDYTFTMPHEDITYTAKWHAYCYEVSVVNNSSADITGIESGDSYDCGSKITLKAHSSDPRNTYKWTRSDGLEAIGDTYSFDVPATDLVIVVTDATPYTREWDHVYFGSYPQTLEIDNDTIDALNSYIEELPTATNSNGWTDFGYIIESKVESYMWYIDIDIDYDYIFDYRGIYFIKYRPYNTTHPDSSTEDAEQALYDYFINTVYWFKYEPIKWNILKDETDELMLIADLILDFQDFDSLYTLESYTHNGGDGYSNNYELSYIRKWLNDDFYNTAFREYEQNIIITKTISNNASTTNDPDNQYCCNNTNDKVFFLSYQEASTYYSDNDDRIAFMSDYAKAQGTPFFDLEKGTWQLRSPDTNGSASTSYISYTGKIYTASTCFVRGVRPVIWIYS